MFLVLVSAIYTIAQWWSRTASVLIATVKSSDDRRINDAFSSFERGSWGDVFHVCIASVGFCSRCCRQRTLADANRRFGEQSGRRASGVSCVSCERRCCERHLQSLI